MNTTVIGTVQNGSMGTIEDRVVVEPSRYIPNIQTVLVPGLSYYSTVEAADEAVRLLRVGQYPVLHGPAYSANEFFCNA